MAIGDTSLQAREPDCVVRPGESIELIRLPGVEFEVLSVMKREDLRGPARYLLELNHDEAGAVYLWHDDPHEVLWEMTHCSP